MKIFIKMRIEEGPPLFYPHTLLHTLIKQTSHFSRGLLYGVNIATKELVIHPSALTAVDHSCPKPPSSAFPLYNPSQVAVKLFT